jgi:hypothetical protein
MIKLLNVIGVFLFCAGPVWCSMTLVKYPEWQLWPTLVASAIVGLGVFLFTRGDTNE